MTSQTTKLSPEQRASKVAKIAALLAKTVANGATAEEAASATAMADQLMARYGIDRSECVEQPKKATTSNDPFDFFRTWREEAEAEAAKQRGQSTDEYRQEKARRQYRENGVHIDEGYHPDCMCVSCSYERSAKARARSQQSRAADDSARQQRNYDFYYTDPSSANTSHRRPRRTRRTRSNSEQYAQSEQPSNNTSTGRKNKSHKNCSHENSSAARARCRRQGGPQ